MADLSVANTILGQLGGHRFVVMTGAKNLVGSENTLSFKFGHNASKSTYLWIRLEVGTDTYSMTFGRIRKHQWITDYKYTLIYAEDLRRIFEKHTGMATNL